MEKDKNRTETDQQGKKPTNKKAWIIGAVVVLCLAAIAGNTNSDDTGAASDSGTTEATQTTAATGQSAEEAEPNTTAKVDAIAREAKAAAAEGFSEAQRDEAVSFIVENYPNFYAGDALMEQALRYGYLLEYAYKDDEAARDYAELGSDLVQAVKYVYRGAETILDEATRNNLAQVEETLKKLGYTVE